MTDMYDQVWSQTKETHQNKDFLIVEHGWEQHVLIDLKSNLVYRYPRTENAARKLVDEVALLRSLHQTTWPIQIPVLRTHTATFTVYDYIPGDVLSDTTVDQLTDQQLGKIGRALGLFLAKLHQTDPKIVQRKQTKQTMTLLDYYHQRINNSQNNRFYLAASADLSKLVSLVDDNGQVVVHGDLHGLNMVISPQTKELVGVIDFSELEIGDRGQDFRKLFMTNGALLDPSIKSYQKATGKTLSKEAILLWAYVNEWANLCYFDKTPENPTYQRALRHLQKWGKV